MSLSGSLTELDWLQMLNGGGVIRNSEADSHKKEPPDTESLGVEAISFGTDVEMKEANEKTTEAETNGDKCEQQVEEDPWKSLSKEEIMTKLKEKAEFHDPSTPNKTIKPSKTYYHTCYHITPNTAMIII